MGPAVVPLGIGPKSGSINHHLMHCLGRQRWLPSLVQGDRAVGGAVGGRRGALGHAGSHKTGGLGVGGGEGVGEGEGVGDLGDVGAGGRLVLAKVQDLKSSFHRERVPGEWGEGCRSSC